MMLAPQLRKAKYQLGVALGGVARGRFLRQLPKNSVGAEIGVFKGDWTRHILNIVEPRTLHLIDGWWKVQGERFGWSGPDTDFGRLTTRQAYEHAQAVVRKYDKKRACTFHVDDDLNCLQEFTDHYFDWVYLDSSHQYEHTRKELEILKNKVKPGGLITGHDWRTNPRHMHHGVYL